MEKVKQISPVNKFLTRLSKLSNYTIGFLSIFSSGYMSYKYLKNITLYEEFNGHFNSPRNILNHRMKLFHLQDAAVRFSLGVLFIGGFSLLCVRLFIPMYITPTQLSAQSECLNSITWEGSEEDTNLNKMIRLNTYETNEEGAYNLEATLERKSRVESYLNLNKSK